MKEVITYSIATAAAAGVLMGAVMKLGPDALAETGGPQILIPGSGSRAITQGYGGGEVLFASRNGEIPEHVIGTDWTRPQYVLAGEVYAYDDDYAPTAPAPDPNIDDAVFVAPVKISSPPKPEPVSYPSIDGDVVGTTQVVEAREDDPEHLPS